MIILSTIVNLYSDKKGEIKKFLEAFYDNNLDIKNDFKWEKCFDNSVEISDIIGAFIDNNDKFKIKREREKHISIKLITEKLENKGFIRVHKSFLVNYLHIYTINYSDVILKNNYKINVNPHRVNDIKKIYQKFIMTEV